MVIEKKLIRDYLHLARKVQRNFEDYGWRITVQKIVEVLWRPIYRRQSYILYRINLGDEIEQKPSSENFTFRLLTSDDQAYFREIEAEAEFLDQKVAKGVAKGNLCLGAFQDGKLAGFNYVAFGEVYMPIVNLTHTFAPETAWSVQITVFKEFRRKGLGSQLRYHIFDILRERGIKRLYGGTLASNEASLKLTERVGFTCYVKIVYQRILFAKFWRYVRV